MSNYLNVFIIALTFLLFSCKMTLEKATKKYQRGQYHAGYQDLTEGYKKLSKDEEKAYVSYLAGRSNEKIGGKSRPYTFQRALKKGFYDSNIYFYLGESLLKSEAYEDAKFYYQKHLELVPDDQHAKNRLITCNTIQEMYSASSPYKVTRISRLNSSGSDFSPMLAPPSYRELYFSSYRRPNVKGKKSPITGQYAGDIYHSIYNSGRNKWSKPEPIETAGIINQVHEEGAPWITEEGQIIYFIQTKHSKDTGRMSTLYASRLQVGVWQTPEEVEIPGVPVGAMILHPTLNLDGTVLYFASDMRGGEGGYDIWRTERTGEGWQIPKNLGDEVNTPGDELFPSFRNDSVLYFSSNYHVGFGGLDIFEAIANKSSWSVSNVGAPINSTQDDFGITFQGDEDQGFFSSNRTGTLKDDLFYFEKEKQVLKVHIDVTNLYTKKREDTVSLRIYSTLGDNYKVTIQNGTFDYILQPEAKYIFSAYKEDFLNGKGTLSTQGASKSHTYLLTLSVSPFGKPFEIPNILYASASSKLTYDAKSSLVKLYEIMMNNPSAIIEIGSNTDIIGNAAYNERLSQERAEVAVQFLIDHGIPPARLRARGYGETLPKRVTLSDATRYNFLKAGDVLTEQFINSLQTEYQQNICHQLNRRTEVRVVANNYRP